MILNVNTDKVVVFTNKLEKMHRSAFPVAIRGALNNAAFDVKKDTLNKSAKRNFIQRQPNFFKANSRVDMARGFDIKSMRATVGMRSLGGTNKAVEDLEQQERGGTIAGRSFIPMKEARTSKSDTKNVRKANRISGISNIIKAKNAKGKNPGQKFIKSAVHAGKGGYVLANLKGKEILWRVNSLKRLKGGGFKLTPLHSFEKSRSVKVSATHFMRKATLESGEKMERYFIEQAKKQIARLR